MNRYRCTPRTIVFLLALTLCAPLLAAPVYKVVDENGNVTYTDQAPEPGAEPVELPGLSIVERPKYQADSVPGEQDAQASEPTLSMRELQRMYRRFQITSPSPEQSIWGTGNTVSIAWDAGMELQPGMQVQVLLDGQPLTTTTAAVISTPALDRGEHQVSARLLDAGGQTIAQAQSVTFFIQQQSRARP